MHGDACRFGRVGGLLRGIEDEMNDMITRFGLLDPALDVLDVAVIQLLLRSCAPPRWFEHQCSSAHDGNTGRHEGLGYAPVRGLVFGCWATYRPAKLVSAFAADGFIFPSENPC